MAVTVLLVGLDFARDHTEPIDRTGSRLADPGTADGAELVGPLPSIPAPVASTPPQPGASTAPSVPRRGSGSFAVAPGESATVGTGKLMRYSVEVENGSGEAADAFATEVETILADKRSWTARGEWAFRRASSGRVDFVVRLATPDTVDKICGAAGLQTGGYVSCRTGPFVMINLARWELAVPDYQGDVALYRQYVVNHEVGHRLGKGHELCPGPGRLAPIMQQQTYGLDGCVANGWPFVDGRYISGPQTSRN